MASFSIKQGQPSLLQGLALGGAQGIASGLQQLAADRLANIKQQQQETKLAQLLGQVPPEKRGELINLLPPEQRLSALYGLGITATQEQQRAAQLQPKPIEQEPTLFAAAQEERARELVPQQPQQPPISPQQLAQESQRLQAGLPTQLKLKDILNEYKDAGVERPNQEKMKELKEAVEQYNMNPAQFAQTAQPIQPQNIPQQPVQQPSQYPLGNVSFAKPLTPMEKIAQEKLEESRKRNLIATEESARKETKEFRDEVNKERRTAKNKLRDLDRLDELEKEGLESPGYYEFLKRSGYDIPALMNPQSQEYDKIATGFIRDAGSTFKGKVSNYEADLFLKLIPTLSLTPSGRSRVRANLKYLERAKLAEAQAMDQVIKQNNGIPPFDLQERVSEKVDPLLNQLSRKFKDDLKKPVPKDPNKLVTAIQAGLGSAVGAIPGAIKGAAKGAIAGGLAGSIAPGLGTTAGALGGAALGALGGSAKDLI